MDIEYMLYSKDIPYDEEYNTEIEELVIRNIEAENFDNHFDNNKNVYIQNNLSGRSANVVALFDIKENSNVLQIIGKYGDLTQNLLKKGANVTCIETIERRAKVNLNRNKSDRLKMICTSSIFDLDLSDKYDYIFMFDVIENIEIFKDDCNQKEDIENLILKYSSMLNENGKLIIGTSNKFGLRHFAGFTKNANEKAFSMLLPKSSKINNYLSKYEIVNILSKIPDYKYKFYYSLPDYEASSVVYTDEYMPNENSSKLKYNIYYNKFNTILFDETEVIKEIVKSGAFDIFANSYIIEISKNISDIKFASFNNFRKKEYRLSTIMKNGFIEKKAMNEYGQNHVKNLIRNIDLLNKLKISTLDKYDNETIISEYSNLNTLDIFLCKVALNNGKEELIKQIDRWYDFVKGKLIISKNVKENVFAKYSIKIDDKLLSKMVFVENGFFDIIFENIFYDISKEKYIVYDQEWFEQFIPAQFILYRALQSLFFHNKKIEKIVSKDELYEYYGINEYISIFDELEEKIQNDIIDDNVVSYFKSTYDSITTVEGLNDKIKTINFYKEIIEKQKNDYSRLEKEYNNKINELNIIKSSRIWKIYRKLSRRK